MNSRQYTASFNFKGTDQQKKVGKLSGGERNRLHLAKLLRTGGNLLLLDEPTNDLDVDTLRALEEALLSFAGCAVVITHDRWFLDRVATHVLAFEGDSQVTWFEGNFEAYEEHRREQLGAEADRPHRITYKRLTRRRERRAAAPLPRCRALPARRRVVHYRVGGVEFAGAANGPVATATQRRPSARAHAMSRGVSPITTARSRGHARPSGPARRRAIRGRSARSSESEPKPPWPDAKWCPRPARLSFRRAIGSRLPVTRDRRTSSRGRGRRGAAPPPARRGPPAKAGSAGRTPRRPPRAAWTTAR